MNAKVRRRIEMGARALDFSRAHPDTSPGYGSALARLEERLTRAEQLAMQQREGIRQVHAASTRKGTLRRMMRQGHLSHLAHVAEVAAREAPELADQFVLTHATRPYLAFRTAARAMAAEALNRRELLEKHGLAGTVLESLAEALDQFDLAAEQGTEGRRAHVGASAELETVSDEVVQIVNLMGGFNRIRFANDSEALAAWESASNVFAAPHSEVKAGPGGTPAAGSEARPAA
jgi:hypothetical protein